MNKTDETYISNIEIEQKNRKRHVCVFDNTEDFSCWLSYGNLTIQVSKILGRTHIGRKISVAQLPICYRKKIFMKAKIFLVFTLSFAKFTAIG